MASIGSTGDNLAFQRTYWVADGHHIKSYLYAVSSKPQTITLDFFDAEGRPVNNVTLEAEPEKAGAVRTIDLAPFIAFAGYSAGMRQARMKLSCSVGTAAVILESAGSRTILPPSILTNETRALFSPVAITQAVNTNLALVNMHDVEATIVVRLICRGRAPELSYQLPAGGVRLISVNSDFSEIYPQAPQENGGYIRIRTRIEVGVSLIEFNRRTPLQQSISVLGGY